MTINWAELTLHEQAVLPLLANTSDEEWTAYPFKSLARLTGLTRDDVSVACRSLRTKGLARHERGLVTEDLEFVGSGYTATPEGSCLFWSHEYQGALDA